VTVSLKSAILIDC